MWRFGPASPLMSHRFSMSDLGFKLVLAPFEVVLADFQLVFQNQSLGLSSFSNRGVLTNRGTDSEPAGTFSYLDRCDAHRRPVYIHVYMYMYMCTCFDICMYVDMYICVFLYICIYVYMSICLYVYMYMCICVYMCIFIYICV